MKKTLLSLMILLTASTAGWSVDTEALKKKHTRIHCELTRIENRRHHLDGKPKPPHIKVAESQSSNWSGYAALSSLSDPTNNSVTDVSGSWTVPVVTPTRTNAYSAIWVGIDGYSDGTVEQLGTESDSYNGVQQNYAWYEMYPQGSFLINDFPVDIGDVISAEVKYLGASKFQLSIFNETKEVYTVIPQKKTKSSSAKRSSAEWIVEAPATNAGILPLADFNTVTWTDCSATINGVKGAISAFPADQIIMVTNNGQIKANTSSLTNGGTGFTVTWEHQ